MCENSNKLSVVFTATVLGGIPVFSLLCDLKMFNFVCVFAFVLMLGPTGGCGEANGERKRTAAAIWRAADGEGGAGQQWA